VKKCDFKAALYEMRKL